MNSFSFIKITLLLGALSFNMHSYSQVDSVEFKKEIRLKTNAKSPLKAMLFSACLPGLGQVYNKKYWKVPIVYATMGTTLYLLNYNHRSYKEYKTSYLVKIKKDTLSLDLYPKASQEDLLVNIKQAKRFRDLNALLTVMFYAVNIIDAYVDAHLSTFDVSEKLSIKIYPSLQMSVYEKKPSGSLTLSLNF